MSRRCMSASLGAAPSATSGAACGARGGGASARAARCRTAPPAPNAPERCLISLREGGLVGSSDVKGRWGAP